MKTQRTHKKSIRINVFCKVAGYETNAEKKNPILFLHSSNEHLKRKLGNQVLLAVKIIKYLGINLSKDVKDLHAENYKTPLKKLRNI